MYSVYAENLNKINQTRHPGDYIRLLRTPALQEGLEVCELRTFSLEDAPPYAALSYSWGCKIDKVPLTLDNGISKRRLNITVDLNDALERLRLPSEDDVWFEWLWVDQICINQANDFEKGDQVSRMKNIFGTAQCVLVWLGKEMPDECHNGALNDIPHGGLSNAKIQDLLDQGHRAWWNRLWVVQEIVFCKALYVWIGWQFQPWRRFLNTFCNSILTSAPFNPALKTDNWRLSSGIDHTHPLIVRSTILFVDTVREKLRANPKGEDLRYLLQETDPSGVSNRLDRVYSLLALATEDYRLNVRVTYGIEEREVFSKIVEHIIRMSRSLDILFSQWPRGRGSRETVARALPMWMPNFSQNVRYDVTVTQWRRGRAGTFASPEIDVKDAVELSIRAIPFGTITTVHQCYQHPGSRETQAPSEMLLKLMSPKIRIPRNHYAQPLDNNVSIAPFEYEEFTEYLDGFWLETSHGYFGYTKSHDVVNGDAIIVPYGASNPFIVRSSGNVSQIWYSLVADCYIEGIMEGELREALEADQLQSKIYKLR